MTQKTENTLALISRFVVGSIFLVFGLNGYYGFLPLSGPTPEGAAFLASLKETGYLFHLLKAVEIGCGILLVSNLFIPLTLIILAPVIVNIFLFNLFFSPGFIYMPIILAGFTMFLAWHYRSVFKWFFKYQINVDPNHEESTPVIMTREESQRFQKHNHA